MIESVRQAVERHGAGQPPWRLFDEAIGTRGEAIGVPPGWSFKGESAAHAMHDALNQPRVGRRRRLLLQLPNCCMRCARARPAEICNRLRGSWLGLSQQIRQLGDTGWTIGGPLESVQVVGLMPPLMPAPILARLIQQAQRSFLISDDCEITVESGLVGLNAEYLAELTEAGVNRLRLPAVSISRESRETAGCDGDLDPGAIVEMAHDAGIANIVVDLVYGLPGRAPTQWARELEAWQRTPATGVMLHAATFATDAPTAGVGTTDQREAEYRELTLAEHMLRRRAGWSEFGVGHFGAIGYETDRTTAFCDRAIDTIAAGAAAGGRVGDLAFVNTPDWQPWVERDMDSVEANVRVRRLHPLHLAALDWYALTESLALNRPAHPDLAEPMAELLNLLDSCGMIGTTDGGVTLTRAGRFWANNITAAMREVVTGRRERSTHYVCDAPSADRLRRRTARLDVE